MKMVFISLFMVICVCVPCIGDEISDISPIFESNSILYVWLNNLRVREGPDLSSKITDTLQFAEEVEYLNEISNIKSKTTIRGKTYNAPWVKIKLKSGKIGWIYSVGLMADFIKIYTESGYPEDQISFAHFYKNLSPFIRNDEGNKLVATEPLDDSDTITKAFYSSYYPDKVADIKYVGNKPRTGDEFFSFERGEGPLYEVLGNQVVEDDGFVVDVRFFEGRELVPITSAWRKFPNDSNQYKELKSRVEKLRKWEIDNMWIKYLDENSNFLAVVLHKVYKGYVMLSIIFATSEEVVFHDHITEYNEGDDLFRVDDMGEFESYNIGIDYLFKIINGYELVYHWDGAEGRNIYFVRQHKDRFILGRRIYQPVSY
jgi:hypothetical protein